MKTLNEKNTTLTTHQQEIFNMLINEVEAKVSSILKSTNIEDYLLSLTGAAGTGKTYLTTQLAQYFIGKQKELASSNNQDYSFVITAPTHKAVGVLADNLRKNNIEASCKTIHSFLGIKPFVDYTTGEERFTVDKTKKTKDCTSILMLDESSMVGSELYEYILEAIEDGRVGLVLFIGDPYQLLPVKDNENRIYKLKNQYTLEEVVRQAKDSYIISIATKLRERIMTKDYMDLKLFFQECSNEYKEMAFFHNKSEFLDAFYHSDEWYNEDKILATYKNKNVDAFNKEIRGKYWEQKEMINPHTLLPGDKLRFKEAYSIRDVTLYHNGETVSVETAEWKYHNDLGIEYWEVKAVNSPKQQIFRVVDPDSMKIFNDKLTAIAKKAKQSKFPENKKYWKTFFGVRDMFADVQYIYASTIHKLQGSTYETAYIDLFSLVNNSYMSMNEKYRLVYVAITRASKDIKIFIPAFNASTVYMEHTRDDIDMVATFKSIDTMLSDMEF
jgi:ATP-dependent exoDNAse (exonuclease V) alpha subunit